MTAGRAYSLAYLTGNGVDPVTAVRIAAETGYDMVSFRLLPAGPGDQIFPILDDPATQRALKQALRETGIAMADAEMIRLSPTTRIDALERFAACAADLGARHVLVAVDDTDETHRQENFEAVCHLLHAHGLTADLEFMPWTAVKDLAAAQRMVVAANHPAAAVLFDTLHFDRCGSTLDELAALDPALMNYVQICDGPVPYDPSDEAMIAVARTARLIPGDGGIDLEAVVPLIPDGMTVSVEVPNHALAAEIGVPELARRALAATRKLLGEQ